MNISTNASGVNAPHTNPTEKGNPVLQMQSEITSHIAVYAEKTFGFGSWQWMVETDQIIWSEGLIHLFGYGPETFGTTQKDLEFFIQHLHPLDKESVRSCLEESRRLQSWVPFETRILTFDGKQKWINAKGETIKTADRVALICTLQDISTQIINQQQKELIALQLEKQENLLKQAEQKFRYGSLEWNLKTNEVVWSEGMMKLLEYTPDSFGYNPKTPDFYLSHLPVEDLQRSKDMIAYYKSSKDFTPFEQKVITKNGTTKILSAQWSFNSDNENVMCLFHDITQEKQKDVQIEQQAWTLESIFRNSPTSMTVLKVIYDDNSQLSDLIYVYISRALLGQTGFSEQKLIGKSMIDFFPGVKKSRFWEAYQNVLLTKEAERFEDYYEYDGYTTWIEGQVAYLDDNHLLSSFTVIDDLKQIQQALNQQSSLFQSVINNSPVCIVLYNAIRDNTGKIIDFIYELSNPANSLVTGMSVEELKGQSWLTHYPDNEKNGLFDQFVSVVETEEGRRMDFQYDAHGIKGWFDGNIVKQGDGILFTYQDITALKQQQQQIEQTNLELVRSNTELENFAYVASHDLQEPLRKVKSFSGLLVKEYGKLLEGNGQMYIQRMQIAVERMQVLINDLLEYSRVGRLEEGFQLTVLNGIITKVWLPLKEEKDTGAKEIQLSIDSLPNIQAIPSQMSQLFVNLLSNAVKFSKPDDALFIRIFAEDLTEDDKNNIRFAEQTEYVKIVVEDNGIGFEPEHKERIFGLFQRLHGRSEYEGSGIGLAICKRIVENHKGFIYAEGQLNQGSRFVLLLPK